MHKRRPDHMTTDHNAGIMLATLYMYLVEILYKSDSGYTDIIFYAYYSIMLI